VVFVSHTGEVYPSGFLPVATGNVRQQPLSRIYAGAALLQQLRDPVALHGRCGRCSYRSICGGSRARAFAATGDPLAEDPSCPYDPPQGQEPSQLREGVGRFGAFLPGAGSGGGAEPAVLAQPTTAAG
jgi:radical SAM protein with 4Fe4S-binding SPASM domain